MTVKELIEELQEYPEHYDVGVAGPECGGSVTGTHPARVGNDEVYIDYEF